MTTVELLEEAANEADDDAAMYDMPHHAARAAELRARAERLRDEIAKARVALGGTFESSARVRLLEALNAPSTPGGPLDR